MEPSLPTLSEWRSSPICRAILNDNGETSRRLPIGIFWKRGEDAPSKLAVAVLVGDTTVRRRVSGAFSTMPCGILSGGGVLVTNPSEDEDEDADVMSTSRQPSAVF